MFDRIKFNSRNESDLMMFGFKFNREPKIWTIEEVHDLWIRSCERAVKRGKESTKVYNEVINEIPKIGNYKKIYYTIDGKVYEYSFSWSSSFKSYGYSSNQVRFSENKVIARGEKIDFILSNEKAFELGERYRKAKKLECSVQRRVKSIMCEMVCDKLKEVYKDKFPPDITQVNIGDKKYYFAVDDQNRYDYLQFHYKGEVQDNTIVV